MKKIKWTILSLAILFSICSAFASRPHNNFTGLYYWTGSGYLPAGTLGVNYVCETSSEICTYSLSGGVYTPYQTGATYTRIAVTTPTTKPTPKTGK